MATYTLNIPASGLIAPQAIGTRSQVAQTLRDGLTKYGAFFKSASQDSNIPIEILVGFSAVESGVGKMIGGASSPTRGLMQWNRNLVYATLEAEKKLGRLNSNEETKLKKFGYTFDSKGKLLRNGKPIEVIPQEDQLIPEFNILVGSILLGQYLDSFHDGGKITTDKKGNKILWAVDDNGNLRLDKVVGVYNTGAYSETGRMARTAPSVYPTVKSFADSVNSVTNAYIKKLLGVNGYIDVMYSEIEKDLAKYK